MYHGRKHFTNEDSLELNGIQKGPLGETGDCTHKGKLSSDFFSDINSAEKQYLLGWIYASGSLFNYKNIMYLGFSIKVQERDKYILDYVKKRIGARIPIKIEVVRGRTYAKLTIANKNIYADLLKYGLTTAKTNELNYPVNAITNHPAFMLGYFDGNGIINTTDNRPTIEITGSESILVSMREILGEELSLKEVSITKTDNLGNSHRVSYSGIQEVNKIGEWLYLWKPKVCLLRNKNEFDRLSITPAIYTHLTNKMKLDASAETSI